MLVEESHVFADYGRSVSGVLVKCNKKCPCNSARSLCRVAAVAVSNNQFAAGSGLS